MEYKRKKAPAGNQKISAPKNREPSGFNTAILGNQGMLGLLQSPVQRVIKGGEDPVEDRDTFLEEAMERFREEMSELLQEDETLTPQLENLARSIFERRFDDQESYDYRDTLSQVVKYILNKLEGRAMVLDVPQIPRNLENATNIAADSTPPTIACANILYRSMSVSEFLTVAGNRTLSSSGSFYSPYIEYTRRYLKRDQPILAAFYFDDTIGSLLRDTLVKFQNSSAHYSRVFKGGLSKRYQLKSEEPSKAQNPSFRKKKTLRGLTPRQITEKIENIQLGVRSAPKAGESSPLIVQNKVVQFRHWAVPELSDHLVAIRVEDLFEPDNIRRELAQFIKEGERLRDVWDMEAQSAYPQVSMLPEPPAEQPPGMMPVVDFYNGGGWQFNPVEQGIGREGRCFWDSLERFLSRENVQMAAEGAGMEYGDYVDLDLIQGFINRYNEIPDVEPIAIMLYMFHYGETNSYNSWLIGQGDHKILNLGYMHAEGEPEGHFVPPADTH